ncbi:hypothetical protein [Xenophilus azovorans]|uniref:hypothetical protein n=1 Tax=Xenophilus azovorans TaxID=151755 RepID=UPI00056E84E2|nr:hypothetical protein [Xenophilus azovorans]
MHNDPEGLKVWTTLHAEWHRTHQAVKTLSTEIRRKQIDAASGHSHQATERELIELERLERLESRLSAEMDEFVTNRLA